MWNDLGTLLLFYLNFKLICILSFEFEMKDFSFSVTQFSLDNSKRAKQFSYLILQKKKVSFKNFT